MKTISALLAAILLLSSPGSSLLKRPREATNADWGPLESQKLAAEAYSLLRAGRIDEAAPLFQKGYAAATAHHNDRAAIRFLSALAGCRFAQYRYREAIEAYSTAQSKAVQIGDYAQAAVNALNASSLYAQLQNIHAAGQAAADALEFLSRAGLMEQQTQVLLQLGWVAALENKKDEAETLYRQAIRLAEFNQDRGLEALAWQRLGMELLARKELNEAAEALFKSYRLRLETGDSRIDASYRNLAELKLAQGDYRSAEQFVDRAIALPAARQHVPAHRIFDLRGRIRLARGDYKGALEDFRAALRDAENWSAEVLPADTFRISAESMLAELYSGQIRSAAELYFTTHDESYLVESWQAAEANRAASLRTRILHANRERLPAEYWEALAALHSIESQLLVAGRPQLARLRAQAEALRFRLTKLEMRIGISSSRFAPRENFLTRISLSQCREVLGNSRRLVTFHLGEKVSYRWVIGPSEISLERLPGQKEVSALAERFRSDVQRNDPGTISSGARLYSVLFGGIDLSPRYWLLALDGVLFETPLAALVSSAPGQPPAYLAEQVTLELVPGAWAVGSHSESPNEGPFVALGDPIYNTADERLEAPRSTRFAARTMFTRFSNSTNALQLPRLAGSGSEIEACAREWTVAPCILLTGQEANGAAFRAAMEQQPAVIHIATHFIQGGDDENRTVIALSLRRGRNVSPEVLTAADISELPVKGSLVVLSGCGSGLGRIRAGSGLLGLARAWLAAGARAVVTSQWPVPDDTGDLFQNFYGRLNDAARKGDRLAPAEALRRAQIDMLHSRTWRSNTSYWAAYGLLGRSN